MSDDISALAVVSLYDHPRHLVFNNYTTIHYPESEFAAAIVPQRPFPALNDPINHRHLSRFNTNRLTHHNQLPDNQSSIGLRVDGTNYMCHQFTQTMYIFN